MAVADGSGGGAEYTWQRSEVRGVEAGWWSAGGEQVCGAAGV